MSHQHFDLRLLGLGLLILVSATWFARPYLPDDLLLGLTLGILLSGAGTLWNSIFHR